MAAAQKKELTRRISLESERFNYSIDYVFYGLLASLASARSINKQNESGVEQYELYLTEAKYKQCRPLLRRLLGNVSAQTLRNKLKKLANNEMLIYDEQTKEYKFPYDYDQKYYIISRDILLYLCLTMRNTVILLFIYLADRFKWKKNYTFTIREIEQALGYSPLARNTMIEAEIRSGLVALKAQGLIDYAKIQVEATTEEDKYKTSRMILKNVETHIFPEVLKQGYMLTLPSQKEQINMNDMLFLEK